MPDREHWYWLDFDPREWRKHHKAVGNVGGYRMSKSDAENIKRQKQQEQAHRAERSGPYVLSHPRDEQKKSWMVGIFTPGMFTPGSIHKSDQYRHISNHQSEQEAWEAGRQEARARDMHHEHSTTPIGQHEYEPPAGGRN